ncbi:hypothetical protein BGX21_010591 [Mortierella sp. AD011]|nr:hypothetical protein BGX21_010591 [Mortierella sp. AD011]
MDQDASDKSTQRIASKTAQLNLNSGAVYPYEDVTSLLESATKDLKTGQLIQVDSFSLFDAMCAIVIMDPKMDTGIIVEELPQYDINRLLNPKEFIWVFDNILVGQMTWLSGHALSQTLFTSCYILRLFEINLEDEPPISSSNAQEPYPPKEFVTLVLKSCTLAIAKSCALIWNEMKKGQVYEEEDFMTNKFGVTLYENFPTSSLVVMLDQAEHWMEELGKQWVDSHYRSEANDIHRGIIERIHYARSFFIALSQVVAPKCSQFPQATTLLVNIRKHVQEIKSTSVLGSQVEGAFDHTVHRKLVTYTPPRAIALLTLEETFTQLDQMCADLEFIAQALPFPDAVNLVNFFIHFGAQKPAPGAFPRSILQTILYDNQVTMGSTMIQEVIRDSIQELVSPAAWIFEIFNESPTKSDVSNSSSLETIPEHAEDDIPAQKRQVQTKLVLFIDKAIKPFVDTLQIAGQNSSRQRRNLRKIVQLWESLQEDAEFFDEEIHAVLDRIRAQQEPETVESVDSDISHRPFYFVSWVYHMKLWVMEWLLLLGFELELYSTFEYSMIYGYIDCVLGAHAQHLRRVQTVVESESLTNNKEGSILKKKKKKKKKPSSDSGTVQSSADTESADSTPASVTPTAILAPAIRATQDLVTIRLQLARGIFLILAALTRVGHLSTTPQHLASHGLNDLETLYRHRFKAFHHLSSPEAMTYQNYLHRLDCEGLDAWQILEYAGEFFSQAKAGLDRLQSFSARDARVDLCEDAWRKDIKSMIKICIANKLAIAGLQKDARVLEQKEFTAETQKRAGAILKRPSKGRDSKQTEARFSFKASVRKPQFEWKYHSLWPVITLA